MPGGNEKLYHKWHSSSQAVSILLNLNLVDPIRQWIDQASPSGHEVGGLLLGRLDPTSECAEVRVESCEPVRISHHLGSTFALTVQEQALLLKRFSQPRDGGLVPVGFVRSDLRNSPNLDAAERHLLRAAGPEAIFLLVRPAPDHAAAFFSAHDFENLNVYNDDYDPGFPFDRTRLQPAVQANPLAVFQTWRLPQWTAAIAACLFLALAGAGDYWRQTRNPGSPSDGLRLNMRRMGKEMRLTWDPRALRGRTVLLVSDGLSQRRIRLNRQEIEHGSALYVPATNEVSFRMETPGDAESIWLVTSAVPPPALQRPAQQHIEPKPAPRKPALKLIHAQSKPPKPALLAPRREPGVEPGSNVTSRVNDPTAVEPVRILPAISKEAHPPLPIAPPEAPDSAVTVSFDATPDARDRRGFEKMPVLRMFKHSHNLQPARPVAEIKPHVPQNLASQAGLVSIQLSVDKNGRVSGVQSLSAQADERLVRLVTDAVQRAWFYPAQDNGRGVSSKLVLTFRFGNPIPTTASRAAVR